MDEWWLSTVLFCNWIFEEIASVVSLSIIVKSCKGRDRKTKNDCFFFAVINIRRRKRRKQARNRKKMTVSCVLLSHVFSVVYRNQFIISPCVFLLLFSSLFKDQIKLTIDCHSHQCRIVFEIVSTIHHEFERRSLSICGWEEEETRERERKQTISWQMQTLQREKKIR